MLAAQTGETNKTKFDNGNQLNQLKDIFHQSRLVLELCVRFLAAPSFL